jgi:5-methylthioadenosine/S-adenosylhomocysteine deaminase
MGTLYGARSIGLEGFTGQLKAGMRADFIALTIRQPHFIPHTDYISHLAYAARGSDVVHVWVDGKQLLRNGQLLTIDEEKILVEAERCFQRLRG